MGRLLLVVVILLALVLALFGLQNPQPVVVQFLGLSSGAVPLYVVILVSALVGVLLSSILGLRSRITTRLRVRRQERQIADLEQQLREARPRALVLDVDEPAASPSAATQVSPPASFPPTREP